MGRTAGSKNKKQKRRSEKLLVAKTMPPLYHTLPGEEFDNDKSQVYAWIKNQPDLIQWLWRQLGSATLLNALVLLTKKLRIEKERW